MVSTKTRKTLAAAFTLASLAAAPAAFAAGLPAPSSNINYTYVEGGYGDVDVDGFDDSGFRIAGAFGGLHPNVALFGEYADWGDVSQLSLGALFHAPLQKGLDFFAGGSYERFDVDHAGNDSGFGLRGGLRWKVPTIPLELIPEVRYVNTDDIETLTSFRLGGLLNIVPNLDLQAAVQAGDDDRLEFGIRYNFN